MLYVPSLFIFKFQSFMRGFGVIKHGGLTQGDNAKLKKKKFVCNTIWGGVAGACKSSMLFTKLKNPPASQL